MGAKNNAIRADMPKWATCVRVELAGDRGPCPPRQPPRGGFPPTRVLSACRLRAGCLGSEGLQQVRAPCGLAACSLHDRRQAGGWRRTASQVPAMDEEQPAGASRPGAPLAMMAQWARWRLPGGAHAGALRPGHSEAADRRSGATSAATTASPHSWHPSAAAAPLLQARWCAAPRST